MSVQNNDDVIRLDESSPLIPVAGAVRHQIPEEPGFLKEKLGAIFGSIPIVLLGIFMYQNFREVHIKALFWSFNLEITWVLLAAAIFGMLIGFFVPPVLRWRKRRALRRIARNTR